MIKFQLRLAVLAVLAAFAAAALSLPAAAQSDAAFASALGKLPSGLAAMAQMKTAPQAPAPVQVQGPTAPADIWAKVFATVLNRGEVTRTEGTNLVTYGLEGPAIKKDKRMVTHSVDFLVLPVEDGRFQARAALFTVTEVLDMPERKLTVQESWVFEAAAAGRLTNAEHYVTIIAGNAAGEITKTTAPVEILALDAAPTKERYTAMLDNWSR